MKKSTIWFIAVVFLSVVGICAWKVAKPHVDRWRQKEASDAKAIKGKITIAVDDWVGYFPFRSARLKKEMLNEGYLLECIDDKADYPARMKSLANNSVNLAVATVDSFVLNGFAEKYPASIVTVIDESKGGDAIVAYTNEVVSLDALRDNRSKKIAFTPDSPSHHLIKVAGVDFDIPFLRAKVSPLKLASKDSADALLKLQRHEVSVAVLWEPQVSKALEIPGVGKILGSEKTSRVIVDILLANHETVRNRPEVVLVLLKTYFRVLKYYRDNPDSLEKELATELRLSDQTAVKNMINGVAWATLTDNAREWFGIQGANSYGTRPEQALVDTIDGVVKVFREVHDFEKNPLPDDNPLMLIKSGFIEEIYSAGVRVGFTNVTGVTTGSRGEAGKFTAVADGRWNHMRDVGTLKVEPIKFQSGIDELTLDGKQAIDEIASKLKHYPNFRIGVRGHTDVKGDSVANQELSLVRAESVMRYLEVTHLIDPNRMHAFGLGGSKPLPRLPGESDRGYGYRLPRVEITLLTDVF